MNTGPAQPCFAKTGLSQPAEVLDYSMSETSILVGEMSSTDGLAAAHRNGGEGLDGTDA